MTPPEYALPVYRWQLEALAFFDHVVYGADNGYASQPSVRYHLDGTPECEYRGAKAFPVPGSHETRFYLASGGADAQMHRLESGVPEEKKNSWAAVPFGAIVPPELDEVANPLLSFETAIEEETEFCGPVRLSLRFSCSEIDSHVIARLGRVDAEGGYHILSMGSIRPACRRIDVARSTATEIAIDIDVPEPLVPGRRKIASRHRQPD
jgi:predicted acyl esterase